MKVSELFGRAGLDFPPELGDIEIETIVTDSRRVTKGSLFICIEGLHTDGHGYIDDAIQAGAAVIVAERVRDACVGGAAAFIMLQNTRKASALLYNALYGNPTEKLKIIGVTGTNGKTSVCTLLCELFEAAGHRCGILGTVCCRSAGGVVLSPQNSDPLANMTTPDPEQLYPMLAQMAEDGVEYVFMEVTSHALALHKTDAIEFEVGVFTNLTQDHLDFHGNMESYYQAKRELFTHCRRAVVNLDDPYGARLLREISCPVTTCSADIGDFCALDVKTRGAAGSIYQMKTPTGSFPVQINIAGSFSVTNSLLAGAVATECGISPKVIRAVFAHTKGVCGRMERVSLEGTKGPIVLIDYAHTPDALEKLLKSVRDFRQTGERITLVFGCGGDRDRSKRKEMAQVASLLSDYVIITTDNSRSEAPAQILSDIVRGMNKEKPFVVIPDRCKAIRMAILRAKEQDIVILAGKGHERYEIDGKGRHPFDEREIVKDALRERTEK